MAITITRGACLYEKVIFVLVSFLGLVCSFTKYISFLLSFEVCILSVNSDDFQGF